MKIGRISYWCFGPNSQWSGRQKITGHSFITIADKTSCNSCCFPVTIGKQKLFQFRTTPIGQHPPSQVQCWSVLHLYWPVAPVKALKCDPTLKRGGGGGRFHFPAQISAICHNRGQNSWYSFSVRCTSSNVWFRSPSPPFQCWITRATGHYQVIWAFRINQSACRASAKLR